MQDNDLYQSLIELISDEHPVQYAGRTESYQSLIELISDLLSFPLPFEIVRVSISYRVNF